MFIISHLHVWGGCLFWMCKTMQSLTCPEPSAITGSLIETDPPLWCGTHFTFHLSTTSACCNPTFLSCTQWMFAIASGEHSRLIGWLGWEEDADGLFWVVWLDGMGRALWNWFPDRKERVGAGGKKQRTFVLRSEAWNGGRIEGWLQSETAGHRERGREREIEREKEKEKEREREKEKDKERESEREKERGERGKRDRWESHQSSSTNFIFLVYSHGAGRDKEPIVLIWVNIAWKAGRGMFSPFTCCHIQIGSLEPL